MDLLISSDQNETFVIGYIVFTFILYFYFKNLFLVFTCLLLWILFSILLLSSILLNGLIIGVTIGLSTSWIMFRVTKLSTKSDHTMILFHALQVLTIFAVLLLSDMTEIIEKTSFRIGIMRLYIGYVTISFFFYFINRQYLNGSLTKAQEYDDMYLYMLISTSIYILLPFVFPTANLEFISIVSAFIVLIYYFIWYNITWKYLTIPKEMSP